MENNGDGFVGFFFGLCVAVIIWGVAICADGSESLSASNKCQSLGYSAGHYEKEAGLVCEQWIEAAKVKDTDVKARKESR